MDLAVRQASSQENHQKVGEGAKLDMANQPMAPSHPFASEEHEKLASSVYLTENRCGNYPQLWLTSCC